MTEKKTKDGDLLETTIDNGIEITLDPSGEIDAVLDDLEALLKNGEVIGALSGKGINASIALVATDGLRSYLAGKKLEAAEDFQTAFEEIRSRIDAGKDRFIKLPSQGEKNGC